MPKNFGPLDPKPKNPAEAQSQVSAKRVSTSHVQKPHAAPNSPRVQRPHVVGAAEDSQVAEFLPARVPIGHTPEVLARRRDEVEKRFCEALGVFFLSML